MGQAVWWLWRDEPCGGRRLARHSAAIHGATGADRVDGAAGGVGGVEITAGNRLVRRTVGADN